MTIYCKECCLSLCLLLIVIMLVQHFEALMEEHLRRRSQYILGAFKAYMEGALVANTFGFGETELENQTGSSTGFKIMLAKLFPKLVEAFSNKGINCSQFKEPE